MFYGVITSLQRLNDTINSNVTLRDSNDNFVLALKIRSLFYVYSNSTLYEEQKSSIEKIKEKLPKSVKNIVFSSQLSIKNVNSGEYLYDSNSRISTKIVNGEIGSEFK